MQLKQFSLICTFFLIALQVLAAPQCQIPARAQNSVTPGIDVLRDDDFAILRGKRVGLVTNQTGIARDGTSTIDILYRAKNCKLVALFGPEHGLRGTATAGATVKNGRDAQTNLPIYSLYGSSKRPSAAVMKTLDILVFDMQDIGSRSYTYISTLGEVMAACARDKKTLVVLDRPNPIGGNRVEGSSAQYSYLSFVSPYPIAYCHGLTMGEVATLINARRYLPGKISCDLKVVKLRGYKRTMTWNDTGLPWIPTSPNIPRSESPFYYAATGIVGELSLLSIGIGTPYQFQVAGAPSLDARRLEQELARRKVVGIEFRAAQWTPKSGTYAGRNCQGVQVIVTDVQRAQLTRVNFELMDALRKIDGQRFASEKWFPNSAKTKMFDLVCGTSDIRRAFLKGESGAQLWARWNKGRDNFANWRRKLLAVLSVLIFTGKSNGFEKQITLVVGDERALSYRQRIVAAR